MKRFLCLCLALLTTLAGMAAAETGLFAMMGSEEQTTQPQEAFSFRNNVCWGMSEDEVLAAEGRTQADYREDDDGLVSLSLDNVSAAGEEAWLSYMFEDDALTAAGYGFLSGDYERLLASVSMKYGEAASMNERMYLYFTRCIESGGTDLDAADALNALQGGRSAGWTGPQDTAIMLFQNEGGVCLLFYVDCAWLEAHMARRGLTLIPEVGWGMSREEVSALIAGEAGEMVDEAKRMGVMRTLVRWHPNFAFGDDFLFAIEEMEGCFLDDALAMWFYQLKDAKEGAYERFGDAMTLLYGDPLPDFDRVVAALHGTAGEFASAAEALYDAYRALAWQEPDGTLVLMVQWEEYNASRLQLLYLDEAALLAASEPQALSTDGL